MGQNHELWYAEAKEGLDISSSGFATVKATKNMPSKLKRHLEKFSCYDTYSPLKGHTRLCLSRCNSGSDSWHVLTKAVAATGYSNRSGFFCHHVAIHRDNRPNCNPVSLLDSTLMESRWDGNVEELQQCRPIPNLNNNTVSRCITWGRLFGDESASGQLLIHVYENKKLYVPISDSNDATNLVREALDLVEPKKAWQITFTTYLASDVERDCHLKFFPSPCPKHITVPKTQTFSFSRTKLDLNATHPLILAARGEQTPERLVQSSDEHDSAKNIPSSEIPLRPVGNYAKSTHGNNEPSQSITTVARPPALPSNADVEQEEAFSVNSLVSSIAGFALGACLAAAIGVWAYYAMNSKYQQEVETNHAFRETLEQDRSEIEATFTNHVNLGLEKLSQTENFEQIEIEIGTPGDETFDLTDAYINLGRLQEKLNEVNQKRRNLSGEVANLKQRLSNLKQRLAQEKAMRESQKHSDRSQQQQQQQQTLPRNSHLQKIKNDN